MSHIIRDTLFYCLEIICSHLPASLSDIYKTLDYHKIPRNVLLKAWQSSFVPIVYTPIPVPATVKGLVEAILKKLGDPLYNKGTTTNQTSRAYDLLAACKSNPEVFNFYS